MGYYGDNMFQDRTDENTYYLHVKYLVNNLSITDESSKAICLQAIESLNNIFEAKELKEKISPIVNELLKIFLIPLIPKITHSDFFVMITEILK